MGITVDRVKIKVGRQLKSIPEDLLNFVELDGFLDEFRSFGFDDDDLGLVQLAVMCAPDEGTLVSGTENLRDCEIVDSESRKAVTVRYVYFGDFKIVPFVTAFVGDGTLTADQAAEAEELIARERAVFEARYTK